MPESPLHLEVLAGLKQQVLRPADPASQERDVAQRAFERYIRNNGVDASTVGQATLRAIQQLQEMGGGGEGV